MYVVIEEFFEEKQYLKKNVLGIYFGEKAAFIRAVTSMWNSEYNKGTREFMMDEERILSQCRNGGNLKEILSTRDMICIKNLYKYMHEYLDSDGILDVSQWSSATFVIESQTHPHSDKTQQQPDPSLETSDSVCAIVAP